MSLPGKVKQQSLMTVQDASKLELQHVKAVPDVLLEVAFDHHRGSKYNQLILPAHQPCGGRLSDRSTRVGRFVHARLPLCSHALAALCQPLPSHWLDVAAVSALLLSARQTDAPSNISNISSYTDYSAQSYTHP
jgi:hypothetical protein